MTAKGRGDRDGDRGGGDEEEMMTAKRRRQWRRP
jgi:hypothetical protein